MVLFLVPEPCISLLPLKVESKHMQDFHCSDSCMFIRCPFLFLFLLSSTLAELIKSAGWPRHRENREFGC